MKKQLLIPILFLSVFITSYAKEPDSVSSNTVSDVVVTAYKDYVKMEGPVITITISGSPYSGFQDFINMLENLPGMSPSASDPTVIGAGLPIYFVDGREIKDNSEENHSAL